MDVDSVAVDGGGTGVVVMWRMIEARGRNISYTWRGVGGGKRAELFTAFFAQSDQRYSNNEILYSGAVAATRSGNQVQERSARHAKQSWVIKREAAFQPFDFDLLADLWLACGDSK
jgi:hypothetical protein